MGGSGVVATELGQSLAARGHTVHFISYEKPFRLREQSDHIYFHKLTINDYALFKYPPYEFTLASKIAEIADQYFLDVLHVHYAVPHIMCAYVAKQMLAGKRDLKIVTTLHGTDVTVMGYDAQMQQMLAFFLQQSDALTAVSDSLATEAKQIFNLQSEVRTIYNFVNIQYFSPQKYEQKFRDIIALPHEKIIIHVSNLRSVKRPMDIIEVFLALHTEIACKLLIVGHGPNKNRMKQYVKLHNLQQKIIFLDDQADLPKLLAVSDVFLLPSEQESFGLAALEAMACGVPVVASDVGGLPELMVHGVTGYLAPVGDIQALAEYCRCVLTDDDIHAAMSLAAYHRAYQTFNTDTIVSEYENMLTEICYAL